MTEQTATTPLEQAYAECRRRALEVRTNGIVNAGTLYGVLADAYALYARLINEGEPTTLEEWAEQGRVVPTRRTDDLLVLVKLLELARTAKGECDDRKAAKYATALRLAVHHGVPTESLPDFIHANGGIEGCARAFRTLFPTNKPPKRSGRWKAPRVTYSKEARHRLTTKVTPNEPFLMVATIRENGTLAVSSCLQTKHLKDEARELAGLPPPPENEPRKRKG